MNRPRVSERWWLWALFLAGALHWLCFFFLIYPEGGDRMFLKRRVPPTAMFQHREFKAHGWFESNNLVRVVQEALRTRTMPYHAPDMHLQTSQHHQNRFLGFPSWPMSPQVVLLYALDPFTFTVVNLLLLYAAGFFGCLLLRRHYGLGLWSFAFLFLLLNFNGYFVEKVVASGPNLLAPLLLPFVIYAMFRASELAPADRRGQGRWGLALGVILAAILYQGDVHIFIQLVTFVLFWGIANVRKWRVLMLSLGSAFSLGAARLLPAAVTFGLAPNPHVYTWRGYPHPETLVEGLALTHSQLWPPMFTWWESSMYVSIVGLWALIYFGIWGPLLRLDWVRFRRWQAFALPCLALLICSFRRFKDYLIPNWIPLLNAEGMTTRYIIIPVVFVAAIAAVNLQGFLETCRSRRAARWLVGGGIVMLAGFLCNHSRVWRMHRIQQEFDFVHAAGWYGLKPNPVWDLILKIGNDPTDTAYIASVWIGVAISAVALGIVGWLLWRWYLRQPPAEFRSRFRKERTYEHRVRDGWRRVRGVRPGAEIA